MFGVPHIYIVDIYIYMYMFLDFFYLYTLYIYIYVSRQVSDAGGRFHIPDAPWHNMDEVEHFPDLAMD